MEYGIVRQSDGWAPPEDQRTAPRYTSLIRAAKLVTMHGEFVCVIRDVSASGISLRAFHALPGDDTATIELQNGDDFTVRKVRAEGLEASYAFRAPVMVERLVRETWNYPKRQLRLNLSMPLTVRSAVQAARSEAITLNISQQGACIECETPFAIDQQIMVQCDHMSETRAKVRWREGDQYGVVFDNTFTLREFAMLAAGVQCPVLLG